MEIKQVILLRTDLKMSIGKSVAQACHASLESYKLADKKSVKSWERQGMKKVILKVDQETILDTYKKVKGEKLPCYLVKDAGRTELASGTITALGIGPTEEDKINKFTKDLKLL